MAEFMIFSFYQHEFIHSFINKTESDDYLPIEQNNLQECWVSISSSDVSAVICEGDRAYIAAVEGVLGCAITVAARVYW